MVLHRGESSIEVVALRYEPVAGGTGVFSRVGYETGFDTAASKAETEYCTRH